MIDSKKIGFLLVLALLIGIGVVYLRTAHMQSVYRLTHCCSEEHQLRQRVWEQQVQLSARIESPRAVRQQVARLGLGLVPGGSSETLDPLTDQLARRESARSGSDARPGG